MFIVYIIQSEIDSSYYVGHCEDLADRLNRHNQGRNKYTKNIKPWKLVYAEQHEERGEAMKRENEIKRKKSRKYIEWLIRK